MGLVPETVSENELKERANGPRVTPEMLVANIKEVTYYYHGLLTIVVITCQNGFTVVGQGACALPENYQKDVGERFALADAKSKLWGFMGYELKTQISLVRDQKPSPDLEMVTYVGTKVIFAKPMSRGVYVQLRGWDLPKDEDESDEGYLVQYPDSDRYISWSPKDVFERAYRTY